MGGGWGRGAAVWPSGSRGRAAGSAQANGDNDLRAVLRQPAVARALPPETVMQWDLSRAMALAAAMLASATLAAAATHRTATGTLASYDPVTRVLTVQSAAGSSEFHVASDARAWEGSRRLQVRDLASHVGEQVTVAWSDSGGVRITHTVRLTETSSARGK